MDDQVCMICLFNANFLYIIEQALNVIECPEFRDLLLLLRQDLKDSQIPHRTKIREEIISAWQKYFAVLQTDLAVSVSHPLAMIV